MIEWIRKLFFKHTEKEDHFPWQTVFLLQYSNDKLSLWGMVIFYFRFSANFLYFVVSLKYYCDHWYWNFKIYYIFIWIINIIYFNKTILKLDSLILWKSKWSIPTLIAEGQSCSSFFSFLPQTTLLFTGFTNTDHNFFPSNTYHFARILRPLWLLVWNTCFYLLTITSITYLQFPTLKIKLIYIIRVNSNLIF